MCSVFIISTEPTMYMVFFKRHVDTHPVPNTKGRSSINAELHGISLVTLYNTYFKMSACNLTQFYF